MALTVDPVDCFTTLFLREALLFRCLLCIFFSESFLDRAWCVNSTVHCALHKPSNSSDWLGYDTNQAPTEALGDTFGSSVHAAAHRLDKDPSYALESTFHKCVSTVSKPRD